MIRPAATAELPLFPPQTEVVRWGVDINGVNRMDDAVEKAHPEKATLIRAVGIEVPTAQPEIELSLGEFLGKTDEELERVASLCGAKVVAHTWGLWEPPQDTTRCFLRSIPPKRFGVPMGQVLVAEVEIIRGLHDIKNGTPAHSKISEGRRIYQETAAGLILKDIGHTQMKQDKSGAVYYLDIEPKLRIQK